MVVIVKFLNGDDLKLGQDDDDATVGKVKVVAAKKLHAYIPEIIVLDHAGYPMANDNHPIESQPDKPATVTAAFRPEERGEDFFRRATLAHVELGDTEGAERALKECRICPLMWAAQEGYNQMVSFLLEVGGGVDVNSVDINGRSALMRCNRVDTAELLLQAGACVNIVNNNGLSSLETHIYRRTGVAPLISKAGFDVSILGVRERSELYRRAVVSLLPPNILPMLLDLGADVNAVDSNGESLLMWASKGSRDENIPMLLRAGAIVNMVDKEGESSLHKATLANNIKAVRQLLSANADMHLGDKSGRSSYFLAFQHQYLRIFKEFEKAEAVARHENKRRRLNPDGENTP